MLLDAPSMTIAQLCPRRFLLEQLYMQKRRHPRRVLNGLLKRMVLELGSGKDPEKVGDSLATEFLEAAARPGLDISGSVYEIAQDFAWYIRNLAELLSRGKIMTMRPVPLIRVGDGISWRCTALEDQTGVLHHYHAVERIDADTLAREGHSWVWADSAFRGVPLTMHLIETGPIRNGHLYSVLTRCWRHPSVEKYYVKLKDGATPGGSYDLVWQQDKPHMRKGWIDMVERDGALPMKTWSFRQPSAEQYKEAAEEVERIVRWLESLPAWYRVPKYRPACDNPVCPWQSCCYPQAIDPEQMGFVAIGTGNFGDRRPIAPDLPPAA